MKTFKHFAVALGLSAALMAPVLAADGPDVQDRDVEQGDVVGTPRPPRPIEVPPSPPAPVIRTEMYKKPDCKTMTWLGHDTSGTGYSVMRPINNGGVARYMDNGRIVLMAPHDDWALNNQPGGDINLWSDQRMARMWIWADQIEPGATPQRAVTNFIESTKAIYCGEWHGPEAVNVAGIPAYKGWGYDVFGNYYFEVYSLQRYGQMYTYAFRTPYENRWNTGLNTDVAYFITHTHPSTSQVLLSLHRNRRQR